MIPPEIARGVPPHLRFNPGGRYDGTDGVEYVRKFHSPTRFALGSCIFPTSAAWKSTVRSAISILESPVIFVDDGEDRGRGH